MVPEFFGCINSAIPFVWKFVPYKRLKKPIIYQSAEAGLKPLFFLTAAVLPDKIKNRSLPRGLTGQNRLDRRRYTIRLISRYTARESIQNASAG